MQLLAATFCYLYLLLPLLLLLTIFATHCCSLLLLTVACLIVAACVARPCVARRLLPSFVSRYSVRSVSSVIMCCRISVHIDFIAVWFAAGPGTLVCIAYL